MSLFEWIVVVELGIIILIGCGALMTLWDVEMWTQRTAARVDSVISDLRSIQDTLIDLPRDLSK